MCRFCYLLYFGENVLFVNSDKTTKFHGKIQAACSSDWPYIEKYYLWKSLEITDYIVLTEQIHPRLYSKASIQSSEYRVTKKQTNKQKQQQQKKDTNSSMVFLLKSTEKYPTRSWKKTLRKSCFHRSNKLVNFI